MTNQTSEVLQRVESLVIELLSAHVNYLGMELGTAPKDKLTLATERYDKAREAVVEQLRTALKDTEWQDIETAPKDETKVLGYCIANGLPYICVIWWRGDKYKTWTDAGYVWRIAHDDASTKGWADTLPNPGPTHWMPLPKPPTTGEK